MSSESPDLEGLPDARRALQKGNISVSGMMRFKLDVLRELCSERGISYSRGTVKKDLVQKLVCEFRSNNCLAALQTTPSVQITPDESQSSDPIEVEASAPVLGKDVLDHVRQGMDQTTLPSWVSPTPRNWGTTERGKLSADQWRVLYTIHLPISLIALWSDGAPRYVDMLHNFMHLVTAVRVASSRVINEEYIKMYEICITAYLEGLKSLYLDASIKPNHHLSLHLGDLMRRFGPVHAYRTFAFERLNYLMQQMPTNKKHGDVSSIFLPPQPVLTSM